jgi:protein O-mannosyl-transferase
LVNRLNEWLKGHQRLMGACLALATILVYAGSLSNGFFLDDVPFILQNPFILNPSLWRRIFTGSIWAFRGVDASYYRPLQFSSYWLIYRLAGPNPAAFHLFQLVLYAATVWVFYRLGCELFENDLAALAGALLWAFHPLHVEAVVWIAALSEVGFGFFYVLAFLLFLRAEKAPAPKLRSHWLAALVYFPALFFKEMAVSLPLLLAGYWFFLGGRSGAASWRQRAVRWAPYLAAVGAYIVIRRIALGFWIGASPQVGRVSIRVVATAVGLLGQYARLFFLPTSLSVYRGFELGPSLRSPWPWITLAGLIVATGFRKREPLLAFLVIWWVVALLPSLDVRQLSFPLPADRISYVPSQGLCLGVSYVLLIGLLPRLRQALLARVVLPALILLTLVWASKTVRSIPQWRDNETMLNHELSESPDTALLHFSKAVTLQFQHSDLDGAMKEYEMAHRLDSAGPRPLGLDYWYYLGLGQIALRKGQTAEAVTDFERAARTIPDNSEAYDALGAIYFPHGDYAKAAEYYVKALQANPYDLGARFSLGTCLMKLGKYQAAAEQFRAARTTDPTYLQAFEAEAKALEADGDSAGGTEVRHLMKK